MVRLKARALLSGAGALSILLGTGGTAVRAAPAPAAPVVRPAAQVTTDIDPSRAYNQPQMLVDPKDPDVRVIVGANYNAGTCGADVSLDGGETWRAGKGNAKPSEYATCVRSDFGPYLGGAYAHGTIYLASAADDKGGQQDVNTLYLSRSTDLGDTWDTTIIHKGKPDAAFTEVNGSTKIGGEHYSLVRMAVDRNNPNYVYVSARLGIADRTPPYGLFGNVVIRGVVAASADGGKTFSDPIDILGNIPRSEYAGDYVPSMTVAPDGTVYAVERERTPPATPDKPFTPDQPAGSPGAGGRLLLSTSTDHGKTWTTKSIDDSAVAGAGNTQANPEMTSDPKTGALYVIFGQRDTPTSESNVWIMHSGDGGKTWDPKVRVNHDATPRDHTLPGVSVAPDGRVDVAWADYRNDTQFQPGGTRQNQLWWDVYYSYSNDAGKTWATDIRVSDRSMNKNEGYTFHSNYGLGGPAGVASTNKAAVFAWADSRRGSIALPVEDFYFTSASFSNPSSEAAGGTSHTARDVALGAGATLAVMGVAMVLAYLGASRRSRPAAQPSTVPTSTG
jgi:hypothetical protein